MAESLRKLAEQERDLPDGHGDWQHVAFGWKSLAPLQRDKIDELEEKLERMTKSKEMFQEGFSRQQAR